MGMDITFFERTYMDKEDHSNTHIGELRGYDIADIIFGDITELAKKELPIVKYSKVELNEADPGYSTYWLDKETVKNYKTILSIMKEVDDDNYIQFEKLVNELEVVFSKNPNANVYLDLSF